jgi:hypothetical protein
MRTSRHNGTATVSQQVAITNLLGCSSMFRHSLKFGADNHKVARIYHGWPMALINSSSFAFAFVICFN